MASRGRGGAGQAGSPQDRRAQRDVSQVQRLGLARGPSTCLPIDSILLSNNMFLCMLDPGHEDFILSGLAFQAADPTDGGSVEIGLYRIEPDRFLPGGFTAARKSVTATVAIGTSYAELLASFGVKKTLSRDDGWMVAIRGVTTGVRVMGMNAYNPPCLSGWKLLAPGSMPDTVASSQLTKWQGIPHVVLLTQLGKRMRTATL